MEVELFVGKSFHWWGYKIVPGREMDNQMCKLLFESPGPPVAGEGDEWKRKLIGQ